jgi:hypothetical protein
MVDRSGEISKRQAVLRQAPTRRASAHADIWTPGGCVLFERGSILYKIRDLLAMGCSTCRTRDHKTARVSDIGSGRRFHWFQIYTGDFAAWGVPMNVSQRKSSMLTWVLPLGKYPAAHASRTVKSARSHGLITPPIVVGTGRRKR